MQAFDGAVDGGLGNFQQVPNRQDLRPLGAFQQLAAIKRSRRGAAEQAGGVEQGIFEAQVFVDGVETLRGQVVFEGAVKGGAVFEELAGWIGDELMNGVTPLEGKELTPARLNEGGGCTQVSRPASGTRRTRRCPAHSRHEAWRQLALTNSGRLNPITDRQ